MAHTVPSRAYGSRGLMDLELIIVSVLALLAARALGGHWTWIIGLGVPAIALGLTGLSSKTQPPITLPAIGASDGMTSSTACRSCHPGHYETWHASYHRTMTRKAQGSTVKAEFTGELTHGPMRMTLYEDGDQLWVRGLNAPEQVAMVTGSHHLESFWVRGDKGWFIQFPWVWLVAEERWIPVEDSFLRPPLESPPIPQVWNDDCIHCHNAGTTRGPNPKVTGLGAAVTELGIACEACHGGGEAHAPAMRNPLKRYAHHLGC